MTLQIRIPLEMFSAVKTKVLEDGGRAHLPTVHKSLGSLPRTSSKQNLKNVESSFLDPHMMLAWILNSSFPL